MPNTQTAHYENNIQITKIIFNDISLFATRKNEIALIICAGGIDEHFHIIVVSLFSLYRKAQLNVI
jgi:hypothetical protein